MFNVNRASALEKLWLSLAAACPLKAKKNKSIKGKSIGSITGAAVAASSWRFNRNVS